jgi:hypothetical protein
MKDPRLNLQFNNSFVAMVYGGLIIAGGLIFLVIMVLT